MSTSYYLVQTEPTPLYGQVKVAKTSGGKTSLLTYCNEAAWVDADGNFLKISRVSPRQRRWPTSRRSWRVGGYRFVDEYGKERDVEEVFGE